MKHCRKLCPLFAFTLLRLHLSPQGVRVLILPSKVLALCCTTYVSSLPETDGLFLDSRSGPRTLHQEKEEQKGAERGTRSSSGHPFPLADRSTDCRGRACSRSTILCKGRRQAHQKRAQEGRARRSCGSRDGCRRGPDTRPCGQACRQEAETCRGRGGASSGPLMWICCSDGG